MMVIKIQSIFSLLLKILIAGIFSLLFLNLFSICFNYSGIHIENKTGATDYTWLSNMLRTNMEEGFSAFHFDSYGFNNVASDDKDVDILLMGSSHMEAVQVQPAENTGALLRHLLPSKKVYNIGISGHNIYTSVKNMKAAVHYYKPSRYVILETDRVVLNDEKMDEILNGTYPKIPSYSSGLFYQSQIYFPVIKTLYKKMTDWRSADALEGKSALNEESKVDVTEFLKKAAADAGNSKLIIIYHPMVELNNDGTLEVEKEGIDVFREACDENGILFVDMSDDFETMYLNEHQLPYGFVNTAVGTGHLNKYGHEVIAQRLAETIQNSEGQE